MRGGKRGIVERRRRAKERREGGQGREGREEGREKGGTVRFEDIFLATGLVHEQPVSECVRNLFQFPQCLRLWPIFQVSVGQTAWNFADFRLQILDVHVPVRARILVESVI